MSHLFCDGEPLFRLDPDEQVEAAFSMKNRSSVVQLEKWKMRRRRICLKRMERPIGIEPTPEPWQGGEVR